MASWCFAREAAMTEGQKNGRFRNSHTTPVLTLRLTRELTVHTSSTTLWRPSSRQPAPAQVSRQSGTPSSAGRLRLPGWPERELGSRPATAARLIFPTPSIGGV